MSDERLRIGDADRDRAAAELGEHYAQGRLTTAEHAERLDAIWAARTRGDLVPVFRDLPGREPVRPRSPGGAWRAGPAWRRGPGRPPGFLLLLLALLVVLTVVTHVPFVLLLVGVLLFVGVRRRRRSGVLGTG